MAVRQYGRIVVVGGASPLWTPANIAIMANCSSLQHVEVVLYDVFHDKAQEIADLCTRMVARAYPYCHMKIRAAERLDDALPGADVVVTCYRNGGHNTEDKLDALARKFGSHQNSYTAGPGACLYVAVQAPPMIALVEKMLKFCPHAYLINCSNPLPAMGMVAVKAGLHPRRVLGFCGALEWLRRDLAGFLGVAQERLTFKIGGTNHCTFITKIWIDGLDASAILHKKVSESKYFDLGMWGKSSMEIKIYHALGYICPGGHASDIFPTIHGEWVAPGPDAPPKPAQFGKDFVQLLKDYTSGKNSEWIPPAVREVPFSWLDALAGDPRMQHFSINIMNLGAVPNLPDWTVPDLECFIDERGIAPLTSAPLPESIAEVVRRHQVTFDMSARAVVQGDRALLRQAIQLCPFGDYMEKADAILAEAKAEFGAGYVF